MFIRSVVGLSKPPEHIQVIDQAKSEPDSQEQRPEMTAIFECIPNLLVEDPCSANCNIKVVTNTNQSNLTAPLNETPRNTIRSPSNSDNASNTIITSNTTSANQKVRTSSFAHNFTRNFNPSQPLDSSNIIAAPEDFQCPENPLFPQV